MNLNICSKRFEAGHEAEMNNFKYDSSFSIFAYSNSKPSESNFEEIKYQQMKVMRASLDFRVYVISRFSYDAS